jgi:hypothetical protein
VLQIAFGYASEDDRLPVEVRRAAMRERSVDGVGLATYTARAQMRTCVRRAPAKPVPFSTKG